MAKAPIDLRSLARSHTETAVKTLASIMNMADAPPAARVGAASALLDRGWGKPDSKHEHVHRNKRASEIADDELADIAVGSGEGVAEAPIDPSQLN
jgi:hypothetical protein